MRAQRMCAYGRRPLQSALSDDRSRSGNNINMQPRALLPSDAVPASIAISCFKQRTRHRATDCPRLGENIFPSCHSCAHRPHRACVCACAHAREEKEEQEQGSRTGKCSRKAMPLVAPPSSRSSTRTHAASAPACAAAKPQSRANACASFAAGRGATRASASTPSSLAASCGSGVPVDSVRPLYHCRKDRGQA